MFKLYTVCLFMLLNGCAVCQRHPDACALGVGFVAGSIIATEEQHHHHDHTATVVPRACAVIGSGSTTCVQ